MRRARPPEVLDVIGTRPRLIEAAGVGAGPRAEQTARRAGKDRPG